MGGVQLPPHAVDKGRCPWLPLIWNYQDLLLVAQTTTSVSTQSNIHLLVPAIFPSTKQQVKNTQNIIKIKTVGIQKG